MRAVVARVTTAAVDIDGRRTAEIGAGLLVLLGVAHEDSDAEADALAKKIYDLRIFADDNGAMNRSLRDVGGEALVVSQFTLLGDVRRGRRPSFVAAAPPLHGRVLYERFVAALRICGVRVQTGEFGAEMAVSSINVGPVTILIDTKKAF